MTGKIKNMVFWIILVLYLIIMPGLVVDNVSKEICTNLHIQVVDSMKHKFIDKQDVLEILKKNNLKLLGEKIKNINTKQVEDVLCRKTLIKNAEVYKAVNGTLYINVGQREPVSRLLDNKNKGFYIDREGNLMALSSKYAPRVVYINGHFEVDKNLKNVHNPGKDVNKKDIKILQDLFKITTFIHQDSFWKAQVEQIYVTPEGEYEMIPRVGAHVIIFGDISQYKEKFFKLNALYKGGFNNLGWNEHEIINLKYNNQVVCKKR